VSRTSSPGFPLGLNALSAARPSQSDRSMEPFVIPQNARPSRPSHLTLSEPVADGSVVNEREDSRNIASQRSLRLRGPFTTGAKRRMANRLTRGAIKPRTSTSPIRMTRLTVLLSLAVVVMVGQNASADYESWMRKHGLGWGDGYHSACNWCGGCARSCTPCGPSHLSPPWPTGLAFAPDLSTPHDRQTPAARPVPMPRIQPHRIQPHRIQPAPRARPLPSVQPAPAPRPQLQSPTLRETRRAPAVRQTALRQSNPWRTPANGSPSTNRAVAPKPAYVCPGSRVASGPSAIRRSTAHAEPWCGGGK